MAIRIQKMIMRNEYRYLQQYAQPTIDRLNNELNLKRDECSMLFDKLTKIEIKSYEDLVKIEQMTN